VVSLLLFLVYRWPITCIIANSKLSGYNTTRVFLV